MLSVAKPMLYYHNNITGTLNLCKLLKKYGAKATIFVNPDYVSNESDPDSDWGFMTWDEIEMAEKTEVSVERRPRSS